MGLFWSQEVHQPPFAAFPLQSHTHNILYPFLGYFVVSVYAVNTHHYCSCLGSGSKPPPALLWVGWLMHPNPLSPHSPLQCLWQLRNVITDHNEEWNQLHHHRYTCPTFNLHNWRSAWMFFRRCLWSWCTAFGYKLNLWDDSAWTICSYQRKCSPSKRKGRTMFHKLGCDVWMMCVFTNKQGIDKGNW